jgi:formate transporter
MGSTLGFGLTRLISGVAFSNAIGIAALKVEIGWADGFFRGVLCNALVCLAVWLSQSARSTTDRILAVLWPVTAFVALGFEHSIANMYFIPLGILLRAPLREETGVVVGDTLGAAGFMNNLIPVTLGNIVGGTLLVAAVYWFVYLRGSPIEAVRQAGPSTTRSGDGPPAKSTRPVPEIAAEC